MSCRRLSSLLSIVSALGCAAPPAMVEEAAIVDGTPAPGAEDDATVAVLTAGGLGLCSGSLIGPRLVLTAKHCVMAEGATETYAARLFTVGTGPTIRTLHTTVGVSEILTTPGPLVISEGANPVTGATGTDIALLVLEEPFPGVEPMPISTLAPELLPGTEVLAIGYGTTRDGSVGTRMRVNATVTGITPVLVEAVEVVCQGDSGGPLLRVLADGSREVVGVTSFGVFSALAGTARCPADRDYWNRVDLYPDLVTAARLHAGECVVLGDETCNSLDDDCNGEVDDGCVELGGACTADADCAHAALPEAFAVAGAVAATCSAGVCVVPCDLLGAGSCGSLPLPFGGETALTGLYCAPAGDGCTGECRPGAAGPGALGAACTSATDCASLLCDGGHCATSCAFDGLSCATGEACSATAEGTCGGCLDAALVPSGRGRGETCASGTECASGQCGREGTCTTACTSDRDCGTDMRCDEGECAVGGRSGTGESCETSRDCSRGVCGTRDGASFCGTSCGSCSAGSECVGGVCAPSLGVVGEVCATGADCESDLCVDGLCTVECGTGAVCAIGTRCEREGERSYCRRPPVVAGGGCNAGGRSASTAWLGLVAAALTLAARRR